MLLQKLPILGALPDAYNDEIVVKIKCPLLEKTVFNYILNDSINNKYMAHIQLQIILMKEKSKIFCVADPLFKTNYKIQIVNVDYNKKMYLVKISLDF